MLNWLPKYAISLSLEHNRHKCYYQTAAQFAAESDASECPVDWASPEEREKAIREDSVWELMWYPDTPIGSYHVAASSLEGLAAYIEAHRTDFD